MINISTVIQMAVKMSQGLKIIMRIKPMTVEMIYCL